MFSSLYVWNFCTDTFINKTIPKRSETISRVIHVVKTTLLCRFPALLCGFHALLCRFPALLCRFHALLCRFPALLCRFPALLCGFHTLLCGFPALLCGKSISTIVGRYPLYRRKESFCFCDLSLWCRGLMIFTEGFLG
jgi:hypothetical protein